MYKVRDHPGKVMKRNNKEQESQPAGRTETKERFPRCSRKSPGWGIGGSGPHGVSDSDMRLTFPRRPVPPLWEGGVRFNDLVVSHTATGLGFCAMTSLGAVAPTSSAPISSPRKPTHAAFAGSECLHCRSKPPDSYIYRGATQGDPERAEVALDLWISSGTLYRRKPGCRAACSWCFCECIKVATRIRLYA